MVQLDTVGKKMKDMEMEQKQLLGVFNGKIGRHYVNIPFRVI